MDLYLVDAAALAKENPATFEVPSADEIAGLRVGDFAKVCFNDLERLWLRIDELVVVGGHPVFYGVVSNQPVAVAGLKYGDVFVFYSKHVYQIMKGVL